MIQTAISLGLAVAIALLSLQTCSQTGERMETAAGLAAYTEALRQYRQANCTQLPQTLNEAALRNGGWLQEKLPPGTTWTAAFTQQGGMVVAVAGNATPEATRALATIVSHSGGIYQSGQVQFTVTPRVNSSLSGSGFMRSQTAYPWRECG